MRTVALIVALVLGIAAAVGVLSYAGNLKRRYREEQRPVKVAVAKRSLKAGDVLDPDMVGARELPMSAVTRRHIGLAEIDRYYGQKLVRNIDKDTEILAPDFTSREVKPASGVLTEGWRAIAVSVDATSGVSGLIRPLDHVDIHATATTRGRTGGVQPETWLVLSDVTVRAVDDRMSQIQQGLMDYRGFRRGYSNLVLEVTPGEAQLLTYLKDYAKLTFALRPRGELGQRMPLEKVDAANVRQLAEQANAERQRKIQELEERRPGP